MYLDVRCWLLGQQLAIARGQGWCLDVSHDLACPEFHADAQGRLQSICLANTNLSPAGYSQQLKLSLLGDRDLATAARSSKFLDSQTFDANICLMIYLTYNFFWPYYSCDFIDTTRSHMTMFHWIKQLHMDPTCHTHNFDNLAWLRFKHSWPLQILH